MNSKCMCNNVNGTNHDVKASVEAHVLVAPSNAYLPEYLPEPFFNGRLWVDADISVCKSHLNTLKSGKAVIVKQSVIDACNDRAAKVINNIQEEEMKREEIKNIIGTKEAEKKEMITITKIDTNVAKRFEPFIDFDKLTVAINEVYGKSWKLGQATMITTLRQAWEDHAFPGAIYVGSDYAGYVGYNDTTCVMVFDRKNRKNAKKVRPMKEFKKLTEVIAADETTNNTEEEKAMTTSPVPGSPIKVKGVYTTNCVKCARALDPTGKTPIYHANADAVRDCMNKPHQQLTHEWTDPAGMTHIQTWFATKDEAKAFAAANGIKTFRRANNEHGFWVWTIKPITADDNS